MRSILSGCPIIPHLMLIVHHPRRDMFLMASHRRACAWHRLLFSNAPIFSLLIRIIDVHAKSIGAIGIAIYTVLARFANRRTGECWPAIGRIARTLDLGRSTVKRYLHRLQAAGLITIEERWDEEGDRTSNHYTLLDPDPRQAMATRQEPSKTPAVLAAATAPDGGGSAATLPSVPADDAGRSTGKRLPIRSPEPKKRNHNNRCSAGKNPPPQHLLPSNTGTELHRRDDDLLPLLEYCRGYQWNAHGY